MSSSASEILKRSFTMTDTSFTFSRSNRFRHSTEKPVDFLLVEPQPNRRSTSFGFGKRTELKVESSAPPPGSYTLPETLTKGRRISTSNIGARLIFQDSFTPGPGSYSQKSQPEGPSFSFKPRPKTKELEVTPSAGNYNPNFSLVEANSYTKIGFGHGHKTIFSRNKEIPGPGSYSVPSLFPCIKSSAPHSFKKPGKPQIKLLNK